MDRSIRKKEKNEQFFLPWKVSLSLKFFLKRYIDLYLSRAIIINFIDYNHLRKLNFLHLNRIMIMMIIKKWKKICDIFFLCVILLPPQFSEIFSFFTMNRKRLHQSSSDEPIISWTKKDKLLYNERRTRKRFTINSRFNQQTNKTPLRKRVIWFIKL